MKRLKLYLALMFTLVLPLSACGKVANDSTGNEEKISSEYVETESFSETGAETLVETEAETIVSPESKVIAPFPGNVLVGYDESDQNGHENLARIKLSGKDIPDGIKKSVKKWNQSDTEADLSYLFLRRADSKILSFTEDSLETSDHGHDQHYYSAVTYDMESGKKLKLQDVVTDMGVLSTEAVKLLEKEYPDKWINAGELEHMKGDYFWSLDYNGLTLYFRPGAIASNGDGLLTVTLPYEKYPDLVKNEYQAYYPAFSESFAEFDSYRYDLDGDEIPETIGFTYDFGSNHKGWALCVKSGEKKKLIKKDYYPNIYYASFIHVSDGKNYVYVYAENEAGDRVTDVYRFEDVKLKFVDRLSVNMLDAGKDTDSGMVYQITDPACFKAKVLKKSGEGYTFKKFHIGEDGLPALNK